MKTNLKITYLLLTIFCVMFLSSCSKKCKEITQIDIQNEFARSFFDFQNYSYWVYSNNIDSTTDSVNISDIKSIYWPENPEKDPSQIPKCYQIEKKHYYLKNENTINITVNAYETLDNDGNINGFVINYYDSERYYNLGFNTSNECIEGEFVGAISIDSVQYANVYKIKSTYYNYPINYRELYICKDFGIIKMVSDDFIKELVSYKIN